MDATDGYRYDLFVSYCHDVEVRDWVRRHLVPVLSQKLLGERGHEPSIYVDDQKIPVGGRWPDELAWALQRSKVLLAVLSPRYFYSAWCLAEWGTFQRRQKELGIGPGGPRPPLVYPIRFSDGNRFPTEVGRIQQEMCFKKLNYPDRQFARSPRYLKFRDRVQGVAERLSPRLDGPPPWEDGWPVERPDPPAPPPTPRPVL